MQKEQAWPTPGCTPRPIRAFRQKRFPLIAKAGDLAFGDGASLLFPAQAVLIEYKIRRWILLRWYKEFLSLDVSGHESRLWLGERVFDSLHSRPTSTSFGKALPKKYQK
jgi:hypothetical protein